MESIVVQKKPRLMRCNQYVECCSVKVTGEEQLVCCVKIRTVSSNVSLIVIHLVTLIIIHK